MTKPTPALTSRSPQAHRTRRMTFDPYVVQDTTWTREELLRARGEKIRHTTHGNRSPRHDTRAA